MTCSTVEGHECLLLPVAQDDLTKLRVANLYFDCPRYTYTRQGLCPYVFVVRLCSFSHWPHAAGPNAKPLPLIYPIRGLGCGWGRGVGGLVGVLGK